MAKKKFIARIKQLREDSYISTADMASYLNIPEETYIRWENGEIGCDFNNTQLKEFDGWDDADLYDIAYIDRSDDESRSGLIFARPIPPKRRKLPKSLSEEMISWYGDPE